MLRHLKLKAEKQKTILLLFAEECAGGGVHVNDEGRVIAAAAVDYMPDEIGAAAVPVEQISDGSVGLVSENFLASVLLGDVKGLVGIYFQKLDVEIVAGRKCVLSSGIYAAGGSVGRVDAGPGVWLGCVHRGGDERS